MPALREQEILGTSVTDGVTDLLFAVRVTGGGVDHVDPGIESAVQQAVNPGFKGVQRADLGPSEPQRTDIHIGGTHASSFHRQNRS